MATVDLSWTDNSGNEDGFRVYRSTTSSPSFPSDYSEIDTVGANTTTYSDTSPPSGTVYYAVTAFNATGESDATTTSIETVTAPSTPQNLSFTDTATEDDLTFAWDAVSWNGDQGQYQVYRAESGGATRSDYSQIDTVAAGTTSYTDTNLEDGERYFYRVGATNSAGDSDPSTEIDAVTILPAATGVSASASAPDSVGVSWSNNDDSSDGGIDVERSTDGFTSVTTITSDLPPSTASYTDTSTTEKTTYEYRIKRNTDHATVRSATAQAETGEKISRKVTANGRGDAAVSRTTSVSRSPLAEGSADAVVSWLAPHAWALPQTPGATTDILLTPSGVETDYESIALTATVSEAKRELLAHYRRAGDVERQGTAFGAFRRIRRDGGDLLTVLPPASDSPPFAERRVAPVDMSAEQVAPRRHEVSLSLGLEEPRAREPVAGGGDSFIADTDTLDLARGETETISLAWTPDGTQLGDWGVAVSTKTDRDAQIVNVSDAPWKFTWPIATLSLTEPRVGRISRGNQAGVPSVTIPLRLNREQASTLLAVGSRIEAVETRSVPDAGNVVVDTLPGDELTCSLDPPANSDIDAATYVLRDWSVTQARPSRPRFDATVTLVRCRS